MEKRYVLIEDLKYWIDLMGLKNGKFTEIDSEVYIKISKWDDVYTDSSLVLIKESAFIEFDEEGKEYQEYKNENINNFKNDFTVFETIYNGSYEF